MAEVETGREGAVLTITLNRPEVLNALTRDLQKQFLAALKDARAEDVRAVVITGAGRGFCVGQDLTEFKEGARDVADRLRANYHPTILAIRELEKPVIAAVNGAAAGAGLSLACACDVRIAADSASFVPAFINVGLVPDSGGTYFIARLLGPARAFEWMSSGRRLTAAEAHEWGLVSEVVDADALAGRAAELERRPCLLAHYHRYLRIYDSSNGRKAIEYAEEAIRAADRPADAYLALGIVLDKHGRRDEALAAFLKAVEIDPAHAEAYRWAAFIYSERGDLLNEYRIARAAFEAEPTDPFYIKHLDHVLMERLGDPHGVIAVMQQAVELDPDNARAHERLGYAWGFIGDQARSVKHYQQAIRLEPGNPALHEGLGWALRRLGRTKDAIAAYRRAAEVAPRRHQPHTALAGMYHQQRRYREAIAEYETALGLGEADPREHASLCAVYHAVSDFQRAADCLRQVLRRDPNNVLAQRLLPEVLDNARLGSNGRR